MSHVSIILCFGFVNPAFAVAGAALAVIPILIHFLNRRRFRTVEWAAMQFLLRAMRENRRRLRIEQWLVLVTRCGLLMLLGLALARPVGCEKSTIATIAASSAALHVLVIDNSYSMAYQADRPHARTHLDQAKLLARQLIDRMKAGADSVTVLTAARPAAAVVLQPIYDLDAAKAAVDRIEQSYSGTDLAGAMRIALDIVRNATDQPTRQLYLLTDCTRSAWTSAQATILPSLARELASLCHVWIFNLSLPNQSNQAVLSIAPAKNLAREGFAGEFQAVVRGYGSTDQAIVQWKFDDKVIGSQILPLDSHTPPLSQSQPPDASGGLHRLSVSLSGDDRLNVDDIRWRVVELTSSLQTLIVQGQYGPGPLDGSAAFLRLALSPRSDQSRADYVMAEVINDLELLTRSLDNYRAVILAAVPHITARQADQLRGFVEQGGALILFMGQTIDAESYNRTLLPRGLLPGPLSRRMSVSEGQRPFAFDFNPSGPLHPLLDVFKYQEKTGLDTTQIFAYWQVDLSPDSKVQRVLDYLPDEQGRRDPAITVHNLGRGQVVFFSTSADAEWTTLPAKPAYVPLMHELLAGIVSSEAGWLNVSVGDVLELPPGLPLAAAPMLKDPQQGDVLVEQVNRSDGRKVLRSIPLSRPGIYTLSTGLRIIPIAVNVPDDEADIRPLDSQAIRKALGEIEMTLLGDQLPPPGLESSGNDFGWNVMLGVLVLVGLECFLAMKFGHSHSL